MIGKNVVPAILQPEQLKFCLIVNYPDQVNGQVEVVPDGKSVLSHRSRHSIIKLRNVNKPLTAHRNRRPHLTVVKSSFGLPNLILDLMMAFGRREFLGVLLLLMLSLHHILDANLKVGPLRLDINLTAMNDNPADNKMPHIGFDLIVVKLLPQRQQLHSLSR